MKYCLLELYHEQEIVDKLWKGEGGVEECRLGGGYLSIYG
jgi:hypothetical protein